MLLTPSPSPWGHVLDLDAHHRLYGKSLALALVLALGSKSLALALGSKSLVLALALGSKSLALALGSKSLVLALASDLESLALALRGLCPWLWCWGSSSWPWPWVPSPWSWPWLQTWSPWLWPWGLCPWPWCWGSSPWPWPCELWSRVRSLCLALNYESSTSHWWRHDIYRDRTGNVHGKHPHSERLIT